MKLKILLGLAVGLNLLLAGWIWKNEKDGKDEISRMVFITNHEPVVVERIITNTTARLAKPARPLDWRTVESADYKQYIANLREIGCPEETIKDVIIADVNKLYKSRAQEGASTNKFEYWKPGNPFSGLFDEQKLQKQQQLTQEKRALLRELLGEDVSLPMDALSSFNPLDDMLDFLPEETRNKLMETEQRFAAKLGKTLKDAQAGDMTAMKAVQAEKDAELAKLLGPEQKLEYDLRLSQSAMLLRMQLTDFEPSEKEFREMFKVRKAFDDEYGIASSAGAGTEEALKRTAAEKQLKEDFKSVLGDQRYKEYRYDQDWSRSSLRKVAAENNVPKETALRVFDVKEIAEAEANQVRKDPNLSPEQQQQALDGIRQQTESTVGQIIGEKAANAYVEQGSWIKQLNKR